MKRMIVVITTLTTKNDVAIANADVKRKIITPRSSTPSMGAFYCCGNFGKEHFPPADRIPSCGDDIAHLDVVRDGKSRGASHIATSPRACAVPSPEIALVRNQGPACALRGASHTLTSPRACSSPRRDHVVCDPRLAIHIGEVAPLINGSDVLSMGSELQVGGETYGASHLATSPRACVNDSHDVMMPTHGSHDVRSDVVDDRYLAIFINGDAYGGAHDAFYDSSCEGSVERVLDQGRHVPGDEGAEICRRKLGLKQILMLEGPGVP
jgi:hypothetical protein